MSAFSMRPLPISSSCFQRAAEDAKEGRLTPGLLREAMEEADWEYLKEEIPKEIRQSREGVARVASIVRAMKELSHPDGQDAERTNVNHLIETTVTVARNEWKYSAEMIPRFAPNLPPVVCVQGAIGRVPLNLMVNAAQAITEKLGRTPEGEKGNITITTESAVNEFSSTSPIPIRRP